MSIRKLLCLNIFCLKKKKKKEVSHKKNRRGILWLCILQIYKFFLHTQTINNKRLECYAEARFLLACASVPFLLFIERQKSSKAYDEDGGVGLGIVLHTAIPSPSKLSHRWALLLSGDMLRTVQVGSPKDKKNKQLTCLITVNIASFSDLHCLIWNLK